MQAIDFIKEYESALASQSWEQVKPLIGLDASVTFSDGTVHQGISKIKLAFEKNFALIKNEKYKISKVKWLKIEDDFAVFIFEYSWSGLIKNKIHSGGGVGSTTITKNNGTWKLLCEHLGKK